MENKFIIRKGFHSKADSTISGSLNITGSSTAITYYGDGGNLTGIENALPSGTISSSIQVDHDQTTNFDIDVHFSQSQISITESQISDLTHTVIPDGTVSSSVQIDVEQTTNFGNIEQYNDADNLAYLNSQNVVSSSVQIDVEQTTNYGNIEQYNDTDNLSYMNSIQVVSGSYVQNLPSDLVSSSDQIDHDQTTNFDANEHFLQSAIVINESQISDFTSSLYLPKSAGVGETLTGKLFGTTAEFTGTVIGSPATGSTEYVTKAQLDAAAGEYYVGTIDPTGNTYPDSSGESSGAYWVVTNLGTGSFTYTAGSLSGSLVRDGYKEIFNGTDFDLIIPPATNWGVIGGTIADQTDLQSELDAKEDSFTKNSAFNKDFGIVTGSVAQGNHVHDLMVSSSIQIDHDQTTNFTSSEHYEQSEISITESQISDLTHTVIPDGTISGSIQVDFDEISNIPSGIISGSSQLDGTTIDSLTLTNVEATGSFSGSFFGDGSNLTGVGSDLPSGVVSGSIQIDHDATTNFTSSEHFEQSAISITESQISDLTHYTDADNLSYMNTIEVVSGSYVSSLPSGSVSSSIQVDHNQTTNYSSSRHFLQSEISITEDQVSDLTHYTDSDNLDYLNELGVVSGSSQISYNGITDIPSGIVSGSSQISFNGITDKPTLVSGSSQISYPEISNIPSGIVSGSDQVSGSFLKNTTDTLDGNLTVTGIITANEIHANYESSSIIYSSGSTKFGDSGDDTHEFTGSVEISGSLTVTGSTDILGNVTATAFYGDGSNLTGIENTLPSGVISGSIQVDHDQTTNFTSSEHFEQSAISIPSSQLTDSSSIAYNNIDNNFSVGQTISGSTVLYDSGSTVFEINGSLGQLFSVTDDLTGDLFKVADISGIPIFKVNSDETVTVDGTLVVNGETTGSSFTVTGGLSTEFLKADGTLDSTTYLSSLPSGVVSGSSQISYNGITDIPSGIISGSSQLDGTTIDNLLLTDVEASGSFSGSFFGDGSNLSGVTSYTDADTRNVLNTDNVFSSSIQIDHDATTNYTASEHINWTIDQGGTQIDPANYETGSGGTYEVFTTGSDGLVPSSSAENTTDFLRRDGSWASPSDSNGTAENETLTATGGESTFPLSNLISISYTYFVYINGVLQQEGAGKDYTLTDTSFTTINFEDNLVTDDFVDVYYNNTSAPNTIVIYDLSAESSTNSATIRLSGSNATTDNVEITGSEGITISYTDSNTITIGNEAVIDLSSYAGHIIPATTNTYDLGSPTKEWRDLYLSSGSLYIDGVVVLSSNATELQITTDSNQSLRMIEDGADTIGIQTDDGDITLVATGTGNIEIDAPMQITAGRNILSSDGNNIHFSNGIDITGSILVSGTVDGVDIANLKSDFDNSQNNSVSSSIQIDHDQTTNYVGNEHIDWTIDQGATDIHTGNYTNDYRTVTAGGNTLGPTETLAFTEGSNITITEIAGAVTINSSGEALPNNVVSGSDQVSGSFVNIDGDTMTGKLTIATAGATTAIDFSNNNGYISGVSRLYGSAAGSVTVLFNSTDTRFYQVPRPNADNSVDLGVFDNRWKDLFAVSGSFDEITSTTYYGDGSNLTGVGSDLPSGVVSGSDQVSGSFLKNTTDTLTGNLTVTGIITANEIHANYESSSIIYSSGSTKFGDTFDDLHEFTGSIEIDSGSLTLGGDLALNGNKITSNGEIDMTTAWWAFKPSSGLGLYAFGSLNFQTSAGRNTTYVDTEPTTDNTKKFGSTTKRFSEMHAAYFSGSFYGDGSNLTGISGGGSGDVSSSLQLDDTTNIAYLNTDNDFAGRIQITETGSASGGPTFIVDASNSSITGETIMKLVTNSTGERKAFQCSKGTDGYAWASFEYVTYPGIVFGVGGSTPRDTNLYRFAANVLKTDDDFVAVGDITASAFSGDGSNLTGITSTVPDGTVSGSIQVDHDATTNFEANEHIDWTIDQGGTDIHTGNYTNDYRTVTAGGNTLGPTETLAFTAGTDITITEIGGAVTINSTASGGGGDYVPLSGSSSITGSITIYESGSTVLDIQGSQGQLFSVSDEEDDILFAVSDISGQPLFEVNVSGSLTASADFKVTGDVTASAYYGDGSNLTGVATGDSLITIPTNITDTAYDVLSTDEGNRSNGVSSSIDQVLTFNTSTTTFAEGEQYNFWRDGTNSVQITGSGVTLHGAGDINGDFYINDGYSPVSVIMESATIGRIIGNLTRNPGSEIVHLTCSSSTDVNNTESFIDWTDTEEKDSIIYEHSESTNNSRISVKEDGTYSIRSSVSIDNTGTNRIGVFILVRIDGSNEVSRTKNYCYGRGVSYSRYSTMMINTNLTLVSGSYIEIKSNAYDVEQATAINLVPDTSEIIVTKIN